MRHNWADLRCIVEKERKKAEKAAKFQQKLAAKATAAPAATSAKAKEKKAKAEKKAEEEVIPEYVEDTPVGEKKRLRSLEDPNFKAYNPVAVGESYTLNVQYI
jgi:valyl-tRNA synthetase